MELTILNFPIMQSDTGCLVPIEDRMITDGIKNEGMGIPFAIKRVFYIYGITPGKERGFHAHHTISQVLICLRGHCRIIMDDGFMRESITLTEPHQGLFIGPYDWHEMVDFSEDTILLVLASDVYHEGDYIRDYDEFLEVVKRRHSNSV